MKECITPQDVCDILNDLLKRDYDAVASLINFHTPCNKALADHPTVQVRAYDPVTKEPTPGKYTVGVVGILNGLFPTRDEGYGILCYNMEDDGRITEFKLTSIGGF